MKKVFCDWGTSNLRAYLLEADRVVNEISSDKGLIAAKELGFAAVLSEVLAQLDAETDAKVFMSGMVGSKHGWKEAPYAATPLTVNALRDNYVEPAENVRIYGGVCHTGSTGKKDVMRGEEVQIFGVLEAHPDIKKICLPGTHSKWVDVSNGQMVSFSTWMTGDLFKSLGQGTIFKEQMSSEEFMEDAFLRGVEAAQTAGPLINSLFYLRTDYLFGNVSSEEFHSYLSGFVIGSEVKDAAGDCREVCLCGSGNMMKYYGLALQKIGVQSTSVEASEATVNGMKIILEESKWTEKIY
jgi:2-dehydro-3-deoxygalactonokinase